MLQKTEQFGFYSYSRGVIQVA